MVVAKYSASLSFAPKILPTSSRAFDIWWSRKCETNVNKETQIGQYANVAEAKGGLGSTFDVSQQKD